MKLSEWIEAKLALPNRSGGRDPIVLSKLQRKILDAAEGHPQVWLIWPKRSGKSLAVACRIVRELVEVPNSLSVVLGPSERQASSVIFRRASEIARVSVRGLDIGTTYVRNPHNNAELRTLPANEESVQGLSPSLIALDEIHEVRADHSGAARTELGGAHRMLLAQSEQAQVWVSSMLGSRSGLTYATKLQVDADERPEVFFDYRHGEGASCKLNPTLSRDFVAAQKRALLPILYATYFLNEPGEVAAALFPPGMIAGAAMRYREPRSAEEWQDLKERWGFEDVSAAIGCGLDRAGVSRSGDRTVWTTVARLDLPGREPVFRVVQCDVLPTGSEAEVLAAWARTQNIFGGWGMKVLMETYGCSDLREKIAHAELVSPTSAAQQVWFNTLYRLFDEGRLGFPRDAGRNPKTRAGGLLRDELGNFQHDCPQTGLVRFGTQPGFDDAVYSLAIAVQAASMGRSGFAIAGPDYEAERKAEPRGPTCVMDTIR